jgi:hypothetical protein
VLERGFERGGRGEIYPRGKKASNPLRIKEIDRNKRPPLFAILGVD